MAELLIGVLVRQMVFLHRQLVPVESAQYSIKVAGYLKKEELVGKLLTIQV